MIVQTTEAWALFQNCVPTVVLRDAVTIDGVTRGVLNQLVVRVDSLNRVIDKTDQLLNVITGNSALLTISKLFPLKAELKEKLPHAFDAATSPATLKTGLSEIVSTAEQEAVTARAGLDRARAQLVSSLMVVAAAVSLVIETGDGRRETW